jgi:hypothetical protein
MFVWVFVAYTCDMRRTLTPEGAAVVANNSAVGVLSAVVKPLRPAVPYCHSSTGHSCSCRVVGACGTPHVTSPVYVHGMCMVTATICVSHVELSLTVWGFEMLYSNHMWFGEGGSMATIACCCLCRLR